jgi:hypothetical protein
LLEGVVQGSAKVHLTPLEMLMKLLLLKELPL